MKRTILTILAFVCAACVKEIRGPQEICFFVNCPGASVESKVAETTRDNLASFNLMATTGGIGSEMERWRVTATRNASTGQFDTGKYWPSADPSYHFYASNAALSFSSEGPTVTVDNTSDIICAYLPQPDYNTANSLTFSHILARVGNLSVASAKGYELSGVEVKIKQVKTSGVYSLRAGTWSGCTGSEYSALSVGDNDYMLIPGTYSIEVSYTLSKGDYTGSFTSSDNIQLMAGKISNISVSIVADPAVAVSFSVSIAPWESRTIGITLG